MSKAPHTGDALRRGFAGADAEQHVAGYLPGDGQNANDEHRAANGDYPTAASLSVTGMLWAIAKTTSRKVNPRIRKLAPLATA